MNEITPELLAEFKDRMKLSDDEDQNLTRILKSSIEDLSYKCGPYDMATSETFKELIFERSRYVYNDALEFFDVNFLKQITVLALAIPGSDGGGSSDPGEPGAPGKSAYDLAVENGFVGSVEEWILSLRGEPGLPGKDGYTPVKNVDYFDGEPGLPGPAGKSAYEIAVVNGFVGTETQWLASIKGERGATGPTGPAGSNASVTNANVIAAIGYIPPSPLEVVKHYSNVAPHQYGNKFEWRYNAITSSLDLVVLD